MGYSDTNAKEVATERLNEARAGIKELQEWLEFMDEAIGRYDEHSGVAFPIYWCERMMDKALSIYNGVARCNGAVLVRGKPKSRPGERR
jgi:hypothetical protein